MKHVVITAVLACALGCTGRPSVSAPTPVGESFDLVIENGRVVDGTGAAWFYGDLGIVGDRIRVVTTRGMLRGDSRVVGKVTQGITTEIFGEGGTPAPLSAGMLQRAMAALDPADTLSRGLLKPGMYADVVVFDPRTIIDQATFEEPLQASIGVRDVFVNGTAVLRDGVHTGAKPGQIVRGPGGRR